MQNASLNPSLEDKPRKTYTEDAITFLSEVPPLTYDANIAALFQPYTQGKLWRKLQGVLPSSTRSCSASGKGGVMLWNGFAKRLAV